MFSYVFASWNTLIVRCCVFILSCTNFSDIWSPHRHDATGHVFSTFPVSRSRFGQKHLHRLTSSSSSSWLSRPWLIHRMCAWAENPEKMGYLAVAFRGTALPGVVLVIYYTSINLWLNLKGDTKHTELSMKFNFPSKCTHVAVKKPFVEYISHECIYRKKTKYTFFTCIHIPGTLAVLFFGGFNPPKEDPYIDQNNNDQHGWRSLKVGTSLASMGSSQWMRNRTTTTDLQATTCWDAWREVGWYVVCSCVKKRVRWRKWFDISKIVYKMLWVNLVGSFVDFDLSSMTLLSCGKWFKDIDANCRTCYFQALSLRLGMTWNWVAMWLEGRFRSLKLFKRFFLYNGHDFKAALSHDGSTFFAPFLATTKPASRWVPNDYSDAVSMKCLNYYVSTFTLITSYGWSNKSCTNWYV